MAVWWNGSSTASYAGLAYGRLRVAPLNKSKKWGKEERKGGKEGKERKEKVAQRHQMVPLPCSTFSLGFMGGGRAAAPIGDEVL